MLHIVQQSYAACSPPCLFARNDAKRLGKMHRKRLQAYLGISFDQVSKINALWSKQIQQDQRNRERRWIIDASTSLCLRLCWKPIEWSNSKSKHFFQKLKKMPKAVCQCCKWCNGIALFVAWWVLCIPIRNAANNAAKQHHAQHCVAFL